MSKAVAIWTGGVHELRHYALREDGQMFKRFQSRGRYGYKWSAWEPAMGIGQAMDMSNLPTTVSSGFATLYRCTPHSACLNDRAWINSDGTIRVRLP